MECKNLSNTPKDPCVKCDPNYIFFVKIDEHTQSFGLTKQKVCQSVMICHLKEVGKHWLSMIFDGSCNRFRC